MPVALYISSDNLVTLSELKDPADDSYVNDAVVDALIKDEGGSTLSGSTITLTKVAGVDGKYQGSIPSTVTMTDGTNYYLHVLPSSSGRNVLIRKVGRAQYYEGCEC